MKLRPTRMVMIGLGEMTIANIPGNGRTLPMPLPDWLTPA